MPKTIPRRQIIKKAIYITPAIVTLAAAPSFAKGGSGRAGKSSTWSSNKSWFASKHKSHY
jgi:hypothetical protein